MTKDFKTNAKNKKTTRRPPPSPPGDAHRPNECFTTHARGPVDGTYQRRVVTRHTTDCFFYPRPPVESLGLHTRARIEEMFTLSASRVAPRAVVSAKTRAAKRSVVAMSSKVRPRKRSRVGWAIAIVDDGGDLAWAIARVIRANDDAWGGVSTRGGRGWGRWFLFGAREARWGIGGRRDGRAGGVDARGRDRWDAIRPWVGGEV